MRNRIQIISLYIVLSLLVMLSCRNKKTVLLQPDLPVAINSESKVKNDSCRFSVSIKGNSILIADHDSSCFIKDLSFIDGFVRQELKSGRLNFDNKYPVNLLIDSMTPYPIVDQLIEELAMLRIHAPFFKTASKGFWLAFPEKDINLQKEVAELYGKRFMKNFITDTSNSQNSDSKGTPSTYTDEPPPPPPPTVSLDFDTIYYVKNIDSTLFGFIEIKNNRFQLNAKPIDQDYLSYIIFRYKRIYFVKMNKDNYYKDFIKIIDLINGARNQRYNFYSNSMFHMNYNELKIEQKREIWVRYGISFTVMSFADQNYIKKNKVNKRENYFLLSL